MASEPSMVIHLTRASQLTTRTLEKSKNQAYGHAVESDPGNSNLALIFERKNVAFPDGTTSIQTVLQVKNDKGAAGDQQGKAFETIGISELQRQAAIHPSSGSPTFAGLVRTSHQPSISIRHQLRNSLYYRIQYTFRTAKDCIRAQQMLELLGIPLKTWTSAPQTAPGTSTVATSVPSADTYRTAATGLSWHHQPGQFIPSQSAFASQTVRTDQSYARPGPSLLESTIPMGTSGRDLQPSTRNQAEQSYNGGASALQPARRLFFEAAEGSFQQSTQVGAMLPPFTQDSVVVSKKRKLVVSSESQRKGKKHIEDKEDVMEDSPVKNLTTTTKTSAPKKPPARKRAPRKIFDNSGTQTETTFTSATTQTNSYQTRSKSAQTTPVIIVTSPTRSRKRSRYSPPPPATLRVITPILEDLDLNKNENAQQSGSTMAYKGVKKTNPFARTRRGVARNVATPKRAAKDQPLALADTEDEDVDMDYDFMNRKSNGINPFVRRSGRVRKKVKIFDSMG